VKYLVEMHGGTVSAESGGVGMGATFTVRLPLGVKRSKDVEGQIISVAEEIETFEIKGNGQLDNVKVLAVDDDRDTLELLRHILRMASAEVRTAASAAKALELMAEWRPHVILCDIAMPEMDGLKLIQTIRDRDAALRQHTPALALTAFARNEDRRAALEAGFDDHLAKPANPDTLIAAVASLIELSRKSERT
ncbi:MAG TPA: response regulator, partial [Blastocatellia bacterium]|nr:response regulator [Blastocatellia bacterium]